MKPGLTLLLGLFCVVPVIHAVTRYVDASPHTPVAPYTSWGTAATNIQDAINSAGGGDTILVADGVYQFGTVNLRGNSRLNTLGKFPKIQSVNGPEVTIIRGSTNSASPVRCAYLTAGSVLSGFTLTNGGSGFGGAGVYCEALSCLVTNCIIVNCYDSNISGGGGANGGTLVDCLLSNNTCLSMGGGACSNTLINCTLMGNRSGRGGGAYRSTLTNCLLVANVGTAIGFGLGGGGAAYSVLANCAVSNNVALGDGGGLYFCTASDSLISSNRSTIGSGGGAYLTANLANSLNRCVIQGNVSANDGGGVYGGSLGDCLVAGNTTDLIREGGGVINATLRNCLVTGNTALRGAGLAHCVGTNCTIAGNLVIGPNGAGAYNSTLNNSIIYYNQAVVNEVVTNADTFASFLTYCCTSSLNNPSSAQSFTNEPSFVDSNADFRLQLDSPCINAGNNSLTTNTNDLDGNPRIVGGTVDVGAYEFQFPASMLSYVWLQRYGLPTDGSADDEDSDSDGMSNRQEWIAGTIPTDASSLLQVYSAIPAGDISSVTVYWQSVAGKKYFVQRSGDLSAFATIQTNITGQTGTTGYTDGNTTNASRFFYRVGVQ